MFKTLFNLIINLFFKPTIKNIEIQPTEKPSIEIKLPEKNEPLMARPFDLPSSNHYSSASFKLLQQEYRFLFPQVTIEPKFQNDVNLCIRRALKQKELYIGKIAPWYILATKHCLEGNGNPNNQILNGQPWNQKTTIVPADQGPFKSFSDSVDFALQYYSKNWNNVNLKAKNWSDWGWCFWFLESWNGLSYRLLKEKNTIPANASPYIYSGALFNNVPLYVKGKYVVDGKFDPNAPSLQIGAMAFLKGLEQIGELK